MRAVILLWSRDIRQAIPQVMPHFLMTNMAGLLMSLNGVINKINIKYRRNYMDIEKLISETTEYDKKESQWKIK